jgi:hypothetical protein
MFFETFVTTTNSEGLIPFFRAGLATTSRNEKSGCEAIAEENARRDYRIFIDHQSFIVIDDVECHDCGPDIMRA